MLRKLLKSRTVIFAVIVAVLSALQGFVFAIPIEPHWQAVIGVILAVIVTLLRIVTKDPISEK